MLCQFLLYSKENLLYTYIYPLFSRFLSHIGHHRVLSRVSCAIQYVLISCLFLKLILLIYLFNQSCTGSLLLRGLFSSCSKWELLFIAVHELLIVVASLVVDHRLQVPGSVVATHRLQSEGSVVVEHGLSFCTACGIFQDQGSNPCPLHWQVNSYPLYYQGSPLFYT